jgi:UDP-N-acetyl-D-mannosaminuronate dehydrogenase
VGATEEILAAVLEKTERIEVATILPDDVVFMHFPEGFDVETAEEYLETVAALLGGKNPVGGFIGAMRIEIKRPEAG